MPMSYTMEDAEDAILGLCKTAWDANTPALVGSVYTPHLVYEQLEDDLKPHPRAGDKAWGRVVVRMTNAGKASLANAAGVARFRRMGIAWVQVFAPSTLSAKAYTLARRLGDVALKAYEGKRTPDGNVLFTRVEVTDLPKDGNWVRKDVKAYFYFDEIH